MESKKIQVGRMEHYAVYLALVISMVTTFLLGVLLTESLFGTGLNYFGRLAEDGSISAASAREPLQWTGPVVNVENSLYSVWTAGGDTYYQFRVDVENAGDEHIRRLILSYDYNRSIFDYVAPGGGISLLDGGSSWFSMLLPQPAHAQVSIDFPIPKQDPLSELCILDVQEDPALCDMTSDGTYFKKGTTRTADLLFRLREPYAVAQPSLFERLFGWFLGKQAKAQVSIDFPMGFMTETTATVVEAETVNGRTNVTGDLSATTSVLIAQ